MSLFAVETVSGTVTSSSASLDRVAYWAVEGYLSTTHQHLFQANHELNPWFQVEFGTKMVILGVRFFTRINDSGYKVRNYYTHVTDTPASGDTLIDADICGFFEGPADEKAQYDIYCDPPMTGKYVIMQCRNEGMVATATLIINELWVYGTQTRGMLSQ